MSRLADNVTSFWLLLVHLSERPVITNYNSFTLDTTLVELRKYRIDVDQAAELRDRLAAFAEDWESPDMDVYDDYDAHKNRL